MTSPPFNISCILLFHIWNSLRSRRLEVVGERENGRARGRHALFLRGQSFSVKIFDRSCNGCQVIRLGGKRFSGTFRAGAPSPLACPSRARVFSCVPTTSKRLLRRLYLEKKKTTQTDEIKSLLPTFIIQIHWLKIFTCRQQHHELLLLRIGHQMRHPPILNEVAPHSNIGIDLGL